MSFYHTVFAALAAITIASPVFAGDTVVQTAADTAPVAATENTRLQPSAEVKINVNKATAKELLKVQGMNPAKARAIVTYRKKHGEFKSLDDLVKVKSLGKLKPEDFKVILNQLKLS
jgi:competence protein ComEA